MEIDSRECTYGNGKWDREKEFIRFGISKSPLRFLGEPGRDTKHDILSWKGYLNTSSQQSQLSPEVKEGNAPSAHFQGENVWWPVRPSGKEQQVQVVES